MDRDDKKLPGRDSQPLRYEPSPDERCFACGRKLGRNPHLVDTRDGQAVFVGRECFKLIQVAGETGYQPKDGPRLWLLSGK